MSPLRLPCVPFLGSLRLIASVLHAASFLGLAAARASCRNGHQPVIDVFRS